jgi:chemotaxis receptor (MCP) glutamine deamidase CheD
MFPSQLVGTDCYDAACTNARRVICQSIGCKNIRAARALLGAAGYVIAAENVGGHGSRRVAFELWSGEVRVTRGAAMPHSPRAAV